MKLVFKISIFYFILLNQTIQSQPQWHIGQILSDTVYDLKVKSCFLTPTSSLIDFPAIAINTSESLLLQFDNFGFDNKDYMYSIIHCNADWSISDLHSMEYIDGFSENYIQQYDFSFNTKLPYVHYDLILPNNDFRFTKSGNYVVVIYDNDDSSKPVLTKRFMVYDQQFLINGKVQQATLAEGRYTDHEIDIIVHLTNDAFINPIRDVKMTIYQGHRWDNSITDLKPSFIDQNRLIYDFEDESSFKAGNEYRFFDSKSVRFFTERVQDIIVDSIDVILLHPDESWANQAYSIYPDIEGYYVPNIMEKNDARIEADYVWVNFCLKQKMFIEKGDVYLYGGLTDWSLKEEYKLKYDRRIGCYETSLLLKQGYYNYTYLFLSKENGRTIIENVDGDFYQTTQDYFIFVYLYDYNFGYDRLLGMQKLTTNGMF